MVDSVDCITQLTGNSAAAALQGSYVLRVGPENLVDSKHAKAYTCKASIRLTEERY